MTDLLCQSTQVYRKFNSILDPSIYEPLPDSWFIGMTDVVGSTNAIAAGRYRDVNFVGASIIANLGNALGTFDFPFSFAGDGATFALPAHHRVIAAVALEQISVFATARFGLAMRSGIAGLREVRDNGLDVKIARYAVSPDASYYMFSGGGVRWAERKLKEGLFAVQVSGGSVSEPDLTGLSCDWSPFESQRGAILSLLVEPRASARDATSFSDVARAVIDLFELADRQASPVPLTPPRHLDGHTEIDHRTWVSVASNSDFRKFDDVLRLTVDCSYEELDKVLRLLSDASKRGVVRFGWHRQSHAIMTCLVPGSGRNANLHFLDGQDGGYARAAAMLRQRS